MEYKEMAARAIILSYLTEGKVPLPKDCAVESQQFVEICETLQAEGNIRNAVFSRRSDKTIAAFLEQAEITNLGESYLEQLFNQLEKYTK